MSLLPSAESIVEEALRGNRDLEVNQIHARTYDLLLEYRSKYYETRLDDFLDALAIDDDCRRIVREALLAPVEASGTEYSNFMEELTRRISQSMQPVSGRIAESCAELELKRSGLRLGVHYKLREKRTDITVTHRSDSGTTQRHRIEVKNMKLRERAARGLAFDGDSLFGFFDDPSEFTEGNLQIMKETCRMTEGYVYIPPKTYSAIERRGLSPATYRLRENTRFGSDMSAFVRGGSLPST